MINPNQVHYCDAARGKISAIVLLSSHEYTHHLRAQFGKQVLPNIMCDKEKNAVVRGILEEWLAKEEKTLLLNCGYTNLVCDALVRRFQHGNPPSTI